MAIKGVEKFTIVKNAASGNGGFQDITYSVKNVFVCVCVCKREKASGTASAQTQLIAAGEFEACGGVQVREQHSKNVNKLVLLSCKVVEKNVVVPNPPTVKTLEQRE